MPKDIISTPQLDTVGHFASSARSSGSASSTAILLIFTLMLADFFDNHGHDDAIGAEAGLLDEEGLPPNTTKIRSST